MNYARLREVFRWAVPAEDLDDTISEAINLACQQVNLHRLSHKEQEQAIYRVWVDGLDKDRPL